MGASTWKTADGREIPIADMADQHLLSTIRVLRRKAPAMQFADGVRTARASAMFGGEMASDAVQREGDEIADMDPVEWMKVHHPCYRALVQEAERRGIISSADGVGATS